MIVIVIVSWETVKTREGERELEMETGETSIGPET
jgi:hypothetical protein